jgi:SAM-dependent methyltransferase
MPQKPKPSSSSRSPARTPRRQKPSRSPCPDRHILYQNAVQCVESEIDFVDTTFKELRGRRAIRLREDFCGTAATACEWVRRRPANLAIGLDLDQPTLDWGLANNITRLKPAARKRITLLNRNVLEPGPGTDGMDAILAMNFSYWVLKTRPLMRQYFQSVHRSLVADGIFFLDTYGGWEATRPQRERRHIDAPMKLGSGRAAGRKGYTYIWDQATFDPITFHGTNHIHFRLPDGRYMRKAFSYDWRVWSIPETRELLEEAGFRQVTVYWEGEDEDGEGNGEFAPAESAETCPAFIAYIVARK